MKLNIYEFMTSNRWEVNSSISSGSSERLISHSWGMRAIANCFESRCFLQESWGYHDTRWHNDADLYTNMRALVLLCHQPLPALHTYSLPYDAAVLWLFSLSSPPHPHSGFSQLCNLHLYQVSKSEEKKCIYSYNAMSQTSSFKK